MYCWAPPAEVTFAYIFLKPDILFSNFVTAWIVTATQNVTERVMVQSSSRTR